MARKRLRAKKSNPKGTQHANTVEKQKEGLADFHMFPELPVELRLMIIEEALREDQKGRPARVVLFDHHTFRISPLVEQSRNLSPILFVDTKFRMVALSIYIALEVVEVGVPYLGEFGNEEDFMNENGDLEYNLDIAKLIDNEGDGESEYYDGPKVCVKSKDQVSISCPP